ncbi:MAG: LysR substrate-binding domain-containing protein [Rhodospirillaceae bacterium]
MSVSYARIRAFNAVARAGSFTRAARSLGVSQPAITAQIRQFEEHYGVLLFDRTGDGVEITEIGRRLYALSQQIDDLESAITELLDHAGDVPGELRFATASPQVFMPLIRRFREAFPQVRVTVTLGATGEARNALLERRVDVGLLHLTEDDSRLETRPYLSQRLCLLVPADHAFAGREQINLSELVGEPMIFRVGPSLTQAMADRALAKAGLTLEPLLRLESREAVTEAVAADLGIGFVLSHDRVPDPRVRGIPIIDATEQIWEGPAWLKVRSRVPAIRAFVRLAEQYGQKAGSAPHS